MLSQVLFLPLLLFYLQGCSAIGRVLAPPPSFKQQVTTMAGEVKHASAELAVLSWVGGIATLAGIAALVVSRGAIGLRAIIVGVCLVILNFAIANYLGWVLVPALVGTGCVSLAWSYITVKQILNRSKCDG